MQKGLLLPGGAGTKRISFYQLAKTVDVDEIGL
jgi:hypothetical protein